MGVGPREWETCRDLVLPALRAAGWDEDQIIEQSRLPMGELLPSVESIDGVRRSGPTTCLSTSRVFR